MTHRVTLTNSSNWDSDLVEVSHGPTHDRKQITLRRGDSIDLGVPYGSDDEAHAIRFHGKQDTSLEEIHYRGPVTVLALDPPADGRHPKKVK